MHDLESEELDDAQAAHYALMGVPCGFVLFFVLTLGVCLAAGQSFGDSVMIALWPAVVGGPFIGAVSGMAVLVLKLENRDRRPATGDAPLRPYAADRAHAA